MTIDYVFHIPAKFSIERDRGSARLGRCYDRQQKAATLSTSTLQDQGRGILDNEFVAHAGTSNQPVKVICGFAARDVNDGHTAMTPEARSHGVEIASVRASWM